MEELQVSGVVLKAINYKEKDKIIHLFSVELGNISAIVRGVAGPKAKLKFCVQPFCFAEFELIKTHDMYVVKNVNLIDSFFDLTAKYDAYLVGISILDICNYLLKPSIISEKLFINTIKSIKNLTYTEVSVGLVALKFYIDLLDNLGYSLNFSECDLCNLKFIGEVSFDIDSGSFRCKQCSNGIPISKQEFSIMKIVSGSDIDRLHTLKFNDDAIKSCLNMVIKNLSVRIGYKIKLNL